jgi:uroporphyrinogen-III synthase
VRPERTLDGVGVVVTRDEPPGGALASRLVAAGARVLHWPTVSLAPPLDPGPLTRALAALERFDWLALTSAHAVDAVAARRAALPADVRVAAVGAATAAAAREHGFRVDRLPADFSSEGLVRQFAAEGDAAGCRILFPASDRAADTIVAGLTALGAEVVRVEAYRTTASALDLRSCLAAAARGEVDVLTFASPSSVDALADALAATPFSVLLASAAVAAIGPTTAAALARRGRPADAIAAPATLDGLAAAAAAAHLRFSERKLLCRS